MDEPIPRHNPGGAVDTRGGARDGDRERRRSDVVRGGDAVPPRRSLPVPRMRAIRGVVLLLPPGTQDRRGRVRRGIACSDLQENGRDGLLGLARRGRDGIEDGTEIFDVEDQGSVREGREWRIGISAGVGFRCEFGGVLRSQSRRADEGGSGIVPSVPLLGIERADHEYAVGSGVGHPHGVHDHGRRSGNEGERRKVGVAQGGREGGGGWWRRRWGGGDRSRWYRRRGRRGYIPGISTICTRTTNA